MTKKDYLDALRNALPKNDANYVEDIVEELDMHFEEAYQAGMTDDEIIDNLGSVYELVTNINAMTEEQAKASDEHAERTKPEEIAFNEPTGIVTGDIDTIVIEGNLEVEIVPGVTPELIEWTFDPGWSFELQKLFQRRNPIRRSESNINVEQTGKTLRLSLDSVRESGNLSISIPDEIRHVFINTKSGDIDVEGVELKELEIDGMSGDIRLYNSVIDNLKIKSVSGDVELDGVSGIVDVSCVSGDINVETHQGMRIFCESISGDVRADTTANEARFLSKSGDIDITLLGSITSAEGKTVSGDIEVRLADPNVTCDVDLLAGDIDNRTDLPMRRIEKRRWIIGEGTGQVSLSTKSGDVTIR